MEERGDGGGGKREVLHSGLREVPLEKHSGEDLTVKGVEVKE